MQNDLRSTIIRYAKLTLDDKHGISWEAFDVLNDLKFIARASDPILADMLDGLLSKATDTYPRIQMTTRIGMTDSQ